MKRIRITACGLLLIQTVCAEPALTNKLSKKRQIGEQYYQITLPIPEKWTPKSGIARDEKNDKRIEFSIADIFDRATLNGLKIISQTHYDRDFELKVTEEENEAETGSGVVKGKIYGLYIVLKNQHYQRVAFFDWQGTPSNKKLYLEMIRDIEIRKVP